MNKWMWKSTLEEIRKSLGRFMAILAIVLLGVSLFCGLKVMREAMLLTEKEYLERSSFFDLQLYSPLGWTAEDAEALLEVDGVLAAEPAYSRDFITPGQGDNEIVYSAMSLTTTVNLVEVKAGRLPTAPDECFGDSMLFSKDDIGSTIVLLDSNDEDTLDAFAYREYTLVGIGTSPLHMNFERGSTSIGSGTISAFVYMLPDGFASERYDDIYVRLDTEGAAPYSEEYDNMMRMLKPGVEAAAAGRMELYREEILLEYEDALDEAREELDNGWEEYEDGLEEFENGKQEAEEKLAEAEAELDAAEAQIASGKWQLQEAEKELAAGEEQLIEAEAQLETGRQLLDFAQAELDPVAEELAARRAEFEAQKAESLARLDASEAEYQAIYDAAQEVLDTSTDPIALSQARTEQAMAQMGLNEVASQRAVLTTQLDATDLLLKGYEAQLALAQGELDKSRAELDAGQAEIDAGRAELEAGRKEIENQWAALRAGEAELREGRKTFEEEKLKAEEELADAEAQLEEGKEKLEDGEKEYAKALDDYETMKDELTGNDLSYLLDRETNVAYVCFENDSAILNDIANVFPVFFFLVAILVCMTTMTRMIDEQRTQIGVLKALGYTQGAILSKYLIYAGSSALLGGVLGFFFGSTFFPEVIWFAYGILYGFAPLHIVFNPWLGLMSLAAAMLCSLGATLFSGRREFANVPAQLMRPKAPTVGKRIFFERFPWLWNRLSFLQKVSVRNLFRYKKRLVMMIMGISGCTALVLTGFGIKDSIQNIVHYQFDEITTYDYSAAFSENMDEGDIEAFLEEVPNAQDCVFIHSGTYDLEFGDKTKSLSLVAAEENLDGFVNMVTQDGADVAYPGNSEVVLTKKAADTMGIRVGDTVTLTDDQQRSITVRVSGICKNYVYSYAFVRLSTFDQQWDSLPLVKSAFINAPEGADVHALGADIASYEKSINVMVSADMENRFESMLSSLDAVVVVVIGSAGALAFIVLYNLTNINITERMREIATIKVLGFYPKESAAYIFRENIMLTVLGSLVGLLLGKAFHAFVMSQINIEMVTFDVRVAPLSYLWAVLITMLFSILISRVMRVKINKINMAESLKSVE